MSNLPDMPPVVEVCPPRGLRGAWLAFRGRWVARFYTDAPAGSWWVEYGDLVDGLNVARRAPAPVYVRADEARVVDADEARLVARHAYQDRRTRLGHDHASALAGAARVSGLTILEAAAAINHPDAKDTP